jgi:leader peptidase (prepilin peptidase)/N-methyltransferase
MYDLFAFVFQNSFLLRGFVLFGLGIILGSFLNVVIYRLPSMLKRKWQQQCSELLGVRCNAETEEASLNLIYPSSHCPICKAKVPWWSNLPILGYFLLNGRCFKCKSMISIRYPLIELSTGLLFVAAGYLSNDTLILPGYLIFICFILCLIMIDFDTYLLPDELTLPLLWAGILFNLQGSIAGSLINSLLGAVIGYLTLWLVFWLFKLITKREGMGYGDFKFLAAILAWLGYQALIPVLLIASSFGIMYFVLAKLTDKLVLHPQIKGQYVPFGPFLGIAGLILLFAGTYLKFLPF